MILRKREGTGKWKRKHQFTFSEEHVLEKAMDLSEDRPRGGGDYDDEGEEEEDDIISNINRHAQTHTCYE